MPLCTIDWKKGACTKCFINLINVESFHKTKLAFKRNRKETKMLDVDVLKNVVDFCIHI